MSQTLSYNLNGVTYLRPVTLKVDLSRIYRSDWFKFVSALVSVTSILSGGAIWIMALQSL